MAVPPFQPVRPATFRLPFAPNAPSARAAAGAVRDFLAGQGLPERELFSCELCVAEAANNAVEYAEGPLAGMPSLAEALCTPDEIELRVTDHTAGFVLPESVPPPAARQNRGRGLFIICSMMDEVRYLRGAKENILIMRKHRCAQQPPGTESGGDATGAPLPMWEKKNDSLAGLPATPGNAGAESAFRPETLSAIFRRCAALGQTNELAEGIGDRLLVDLLHLTSADWCVLRVLSPDNRRLEVAAASEPGLISPPLPLTGPSGRSDGIEAKVATTRQPARFDLRAGSDRREPLRAAGPDASGLVCPLCFAGALVGTVAVGRRDGGFTLGKLQDEVVRAFAEFLAIQMVNLRHHKEDARNRVLARELETAREIQHLLLPRSLPQPAGFGLAGGWHSAREVSGDFYDAIPLGRQSLLLMIADVMGKGVPAALFSTTMRGLLRGLAARSHDPAQLLSGLNRLLHAELSAVDMFITAQIVHLDLHTRQVTAASAGHCPLLFTPFGVNAVAALPTRGLPLGVLPNTVYRRETALLGEPATLLLHTDGLTDTRNAAGTLFGQRRLMSWLHNHAQAGHGAGELRDRLTSELHRFRGEAEMVDDQAFLLLAEENPDTSAIAAAAQLLPRAQHGSFLFPGTN